MSQLQTQMNLLDPVQVDHVDARIQSLLQHLNQVKEKKKTAEEAGKESKVRGQILSKLLSNECLIERAF